MQGDVATSGPWSFPPIGAKIAVFISLPKSPSPSNRRRGPEFSSKVLSTSRRRSRRAAWVCACQGKVPTLPPAHSTRSVHRTLSLGQAESFLVKHEVQIRRVGLRSSTMSSSVIAGISQGVNSRSAAGMPQLDKARGLLGQFSPVLGRLIGSQGLLK